jgi:hypothetical protein
VGLGRQVHRRNVFGSQHCAGVAVNVHSGIEQALQDCQDHMIVPAGAKQVTRQKQRRPTANWGEFGGPNGRGLVQQFPGKLAKAPAGEQRPATDHSRPK